MPLIALWTFHAFAMDTKSLWNFADPAASEALFRARLAGARGDDALSLHGEGRYDEALASFKAALAARERTAKSADIRVAH